MFNKYKDKYCRPDIDALREKVIGAPDSHTRRLALVEFEAAVRRDAINITER